MSHDRRYCRIYYDNLEHEFPEVWRDALLRGDYALLLALADRSWPASPEVPRLARPRSVRRLADVGLILLVPPYHYRIRGMDKDREARRRQAAHAASVRYARSSADSSAASSADARAPYLPTRAEPTRAEPSRADAPAEDDTPEMSAVQWLARHKVVLQPHDGYYRHLLMAVERHGIEAVLAGLDALHGAGMPDGDTKGYVFGVRDELDRRKRPNLRAVEKGEDASRRTADWQRRVERTKLRAHDNGYHADERDPGCPRCREVA